MPHDKAGNRLFRKISVKVVFPDYVFKPKTYITQAEPKKGFNSDNIDQFLMSIADQLDTLYPYWEFKAIELSPVGSTARWVLTFEQYRTPATVEVSPGQIIDPNEERSAYTPDSVESFRLRGIETEQDSTLQSSQSLESGFTE